MITALLLVAYLQTTRPLPPDLPPEEVRVEEQEPVPAQEPAPTTAPSPAAPPAAPPSLISQANAAPFDVVPQVGVMRTFTSAESTTDPSLVVDADGPIAVGSGHSAGRIGGHLALTTAPGVSSVAKLENYRSVDVSLWAGRVIGASRSAMTTAIVEATFSNRLRAADQAAPVDTLSRAVGLGLRFAARGSPAYVQILVGYDEMTSSCPQGVQCAGGHSGLAYTVRGQVPVKLRGQPVFILGGVASLSGGQSVPWLARHDVERLYVNANPVAAYKAILNKK